MDGDESTAVVFGNICDHDKRDELIPSNGHANIVTWTDIRTHACIHNEGFVHAGAEPSLSIIAA